MKLSIQARYLDIEWQQYGRAREITVAPEPIEISENDDGTLVAETQVFNGLCPWVGLFLEGPLAEEEPAFMGLEGQISPMLRIEDAQGRQWWVQNDGWDTLGKRHLSELHRSMGQFRIQIGSRKLLINNIVDEISRLDVEEYLREFQQDLIWLVMGFGGASAKVGGGLGGNQELLDAIQTFVETSRRVLKNPARHVREIQIESQPSHLRPNTATFRHYLRNQSAQHLPGRGAEETVDIADNHYLRHMIQVCEKYASQILRSSIRQAKNFAALALLEDERSISYENMTHRKVDPAIFDRQLNELKKKLERVQGYYDTEPKQGESTQTLEFRPGDYFASKSDRIFFNEKDGRQAIGEVNEKKYKFSVLKIPEQLIKLIQETKKFCEYYVLEGAGKATLVPIKNNNYYRLISFTQIYSVKILTNALVQKEARRAKLVKDNWLAVMTSKERAENSQEARTAKLRGKVYEEHAQRAEQYSSALIQSQNELKAQDLDWDRMGVASSENMPMGVRFSQSPDYAACRVSFSKVIALANNNGIDVEALNSIDQISLLHASAIYERWCLVKIISVLIEDYRFQPESDWQHRVVSGVTGKPQSISLKFHREDIGMFAYLDVQPEFSNGRRPDFRLRFSYDEIEPSSAGLVMDAKFRTVWRRGELGKLLDSLISEKDYGQLGDRVFILHPTPRAMLRPTSPLSWGADCDYGHEADNNHRKGVVYMVPRGSEISAEGNLKRLIAMLLQATFPLPSEKKISEGIAFVSSSFCISCGSKHRAIDIEKKFTKRDYPYWVFSCKECGMQSTRTHCFGCQVSVLFKNGFHFTYHRTLADQITNIVCPNCDQYFDSDVHERRGR